MYAYEKPRKVEALEGFLFPYTDTHAIANADTWARAARNSDDALFRFRHLMDAREAVAERAGALHPSRPRVLLHLDGGTLAGFVFEDDAGKLFVAWF